VSTILKAPNRLTAAERKATTTLYLAGPFEDSDGTAGQQRSWRDEVLDAVADLEITVIDPRSERWAGLEVGSPGRRGAFEWQCASATDADVVRGPACADSPAHPGRAGRKTEYPGSR
jgi:uncharacterized membrane-anchored protein